MSQTTIATMNQFEAALRDSGLPRLRLDQIVTIYHKTFPAEAMRPDMRQCLRNQIVDMIDAGLVIVEGGEMGEDPLSLPQAIALPQVDERNFSEH